MILNRFAKVFEHTENSSKIIIIPDDEESAFIYYWAGDTVSYVFKHEGKFLDWRSIIDLMSERIFFEKFEDVNKAQSGWLDVTQILDDIEYYY